MFVCLKSGADSEEWAAAVDDLDTLLWSIQPLNSLEDVERREQGSGELMARLRFGMGLINQADDETAEAIGQLEEHLKEISEHDRAFLTDDEAPAPLSEEETEVIKEVKLAEPVEPDDPALIPEPEYLERIDTLSEGTWVELKLEDGESVRCKLATIVGAGQRYIFVNRRGMKVAERSRVQLAASVSSGDALVLDDAEVFDKALEAVIGNLRQLRASGEK